MPLKMTMVLTSLHMDLTYQEKEQVDASYFYECNGSEMFVASLTSL